MSVRKLLALLLIFTLVLAACGGGGEEEAVDDGEEAGSVFALHKGCCDFQKCRFTGAVATHQAHGFLWENIKLRPIENGVSAVREGNVLQGEERRRGHGRCIYRLNRIDARENAPLALPVYLFPLYIRERTHLLF